MVSEVSVVGEIPFFIHTVRRRNEGCGYEEVTELWPVADQERTHPNGRSGLGQDPRSPGVGA